MDVLFSSNNINFVKINFSLIEDYLKLLNNPNIYVYLTANHKDVTYEDEVEFINKHQDDEMYSMLDKETGEFIGHISFNEINGTKAELGIMISEKYQNKHLGTEAIKTFLAYGFDELKLKEIYLVVFSNNDKAIHCYTNLGFKKYKTVTDVAIINGEHVDDIYMHILKP